MAEVFGRECENQHDLMVSVLLEAGGLDAEKLRPMGASGQIADVVFADSDLIVEVKSLETDRPSDPAIQRKVGEKLNSDSSQFGGPILFGTRQIDLTSLPEPTAWNILRIIGRNAQAAVDKANRQIKATKQVLNRPNALGCLALICPPHELDHDVVLQLIADAIRGGRNSAIHLAVVAHSPMLAPFGRQVGDSSLVFQGREGIRPSAAMLRKIGAAWAAAHGQPLIEGFPPGKGR